MKKILLFALPLMMMCFASCEKKWTDDSPIIQFKDPKFLEAALKGGKVPSGQPSGAFFIVPVDKNGDGQISEKEASIVEGLSLSSGIRNLEEIKYFTSLAYLECGRNQLTSLDVSNNTALTYLDCNGNQLTTLDLSNNTALTELNCGSNQLTSLDVSKNTALTELSCGGNQLTSLDVSKNTALTSLGCDENQLTTLDVSNNPALTILYCTGNQLTSLDLSNNTELTWLWCYSNGITSLDVSMCRNIKQLRCVNFEYSSLNGSYNIYKIHYDTKCPLEALKLYKYQVITDVYMEALDRVYGNIIEYVE